jgi:hypothetical protein
MAKAKPAASQSARAEPVEAPFNALRITSAREGFRRAGWKWSSQPTTVPLTEFSAEQVAMLRAEPMLTVEDVAVRAEPVEAPVEGQAAE